MRRKDQSGELLVEILIGATLIAILLMVSFILTARVLVTLQRNGIAHRADETLKPLSQTGCTDNGSEILTCSRGKHSLFIVREWP